MSGAGLAIDPSQILATTLCQTVLSCAYLQLDLLRCHPIETLYYYTPSIRK